MNLDTEQIAAVQSTSENSLVLAGPGSGKTRCIVERVAYLIEQRKVSPFEVLCITFTRKAAGEMRDRLEKRIGDDAKKVQIGTFHATALKLLKRFGEMVGLKGKSLTVYSEFEAAYLLKEVAIDIGVYNGKSWKVPKREIDALFNRYYQEGIEPKEEEAGYAVFKEFGNRTLENNSVCYGGLLNALYLLLPHIGKYLHWKHIILDEAHDTDRLQWKILEKMREICGAAFYVVADENQAIYSWRGAYPEYLLEHKDEFTIYPLTSNYRSCPEIVAAANTLIENNVGRIPRTMRATRRDEGAVNIENNMDTERVSGVISSLCGVLPHGTMAVLGRNHFLLKKLSIVLDLQGIPHTYIGRSTELMDSQAFRQFHAFLKLLVNPYDNFSFLLIRDILGLSRAEYNAIRLRATQESKSHFQVWHENGGERHIVSPGNWFDLAQELTFNEAITNLVSSIDQITEIIDVQKFVDAWLEDNPEGTAADYLDWLATWDYAEEIAEDDDKLKLLSIHAAKGLEFPLVMLIGCNEGIIPSKQAVDSGEIEQERRLFYVAMTRAKDSLILAVRPERKEDERGKVYFNPVSRFVREAIL